MSIFYHEEPPNHSRKCRFLTSALKVAFCHCHTFHGRLSSSSQEQEDYSTSDFDDEQEVVVSVIRSRAMEAKLRRKSGYILEDFSWVFSPTTGELFITPRTEQEKEENSGREDNKEDFYSVGSCFSPCSSATSREAFLSVKTSFSRCSSLNGLDFRRSIIYEFCHCEGWPFGLCRKALLLPPLPPSPSDSWLFRKRSKSVKIPYV